MTVQMVKCQLQCMSGKIFQVEIHIISKSVIIKSMIDGAFCTFLCIHVRTPCKVNAYTHMYLLFLLLLNLLIFK